MDLLQKNFYNLVSFFDAAKRTNWFEKPIDRRSRAPETDRYDAMQQWNCGQRGIAFSYISHGVT
jgi:hypothetical protein